MRNGAKAESLDCCTGDERFLPLLASKYVVKFLFYNLVNVTSKRWSRLGRGRMKFQEYLFLWFSSVCRLVVACSSVSASVMCLCRRRRWREKEWRPSCFPATGTAKKSLLFTSSDGFFFLQRMDFDGLKTSCEIVSVEIAKERQKTGEARPEVSCTSWHATGPDRASVIMVFGGWSTTFIILCQCHWRTLIEKKSSWRSFTQVLDFIREVNLWQGQVFSFQVARRRDHVLTLFCVRFFFFIGVTRFRSSNSRAQLPVPDASLFQSSPLYFASHTFNNLPPPYARSTHSQNLKEKHSSTYFHFDAPAPDIKTNIAYAPPRLTFFRQVSNTLFPQHNCKSLSLFLSLSLSLSLSPLSKPLSLSESLSLSLLYKAPAFLQAQ